MASFADDDGWRELKRRDEFSAVISRLKQRRRDASDVRRRDGEMARSAERSGLSSAP